MPRGSGRQRHGQRPAPTQSSPQPQLATAGPTWGGSGVPEVSSWGGADMGPPVATPPAEAMSSSQPPAMEPRAPSSEPLRGQLHPREVACVWEDTPQRMSMMAIVRGRPCVISWEFARTWAPRARIRTIIRFSGAVRGHATDATGPFTLRRIRSRFRGQHRRRKNGASSKPTAPMFGLADRASGRPWTIAVIDGLQTSPRATPGTHPIFGKHRGRKLCRVPLEVGRGSPGSQEWTLARSLTWKWAFGVRMWTKLGIVTEPHGYRIGKYGYCIGVVLPLHL